MICPCNRSFGSGRVLSHPPGKGVSAVLAGWKGRALPLCLPPPKYTFSEQIHFEKQMFPGVEMNRTEVAEELDHG